MENNDWRLPTSPIRNTIFDDIHFILSDIKDDGYKVQILNWMQFDKDPYIWIAYRLGVLNREPINLEYLEPYIERIKDYLELNNLHVTEYDLLSDRESNPKEFTIYFNKKNLSNSDIYI